MSSWGILLASVKSAITNRDKEAKVRTVHKNLQTTLRYAQQSDATADAEIRAWRRKKRH
jgi:hypothetical protein